LPLQTTPDLEYNNERDDCLFNDLKLDDAAFEIFFKKNFISLCYYCQIKFGFDIDLAKEAVHTAFIKLWENRQTLSADLSITAYLYKIISNTCVDVLRHEKVKQKHEKYVLQNNCDDSLQNNYDHPDIRYLAADIDKAVSDLPEQMRRVFELSRYEGLKYTEISSHLNISVKTVETQISRALVKLRQKLSIYLPLYFILFLFNF